MQDSIEENSEFKQSEYFIEQNNYENIWIVNRIFENSCPQPDKSLNIFEVPFKQNFDKNEILRKWKKAFTFF